MIRRLLEKFLFSSRWLLVPIYIGLAIALVGLVVKAAQHVWHFGAHILSSTESELVLDALGLIDLSLTASLIVIVIFSGYENFVSRVDSQSHDNWPEWMARIDFTGLKLKLLSSIVAISAIQTLRVFMDMANQSDRVLAWNVGIHLSFVLSAVLLALSDRISGHGNSPSEDGGH